MATEQEFVIEVSAPALTWLGAPSDEQDETELITTTDPDLALRLCSFRRAADMALLQAKRHHGRSFRVVGPPTRVQIGPTDV